MPWLPGHQPSALFDLPRRDVRMGMVTSVSPGPALVSCPAPWRGPRGRRRPGNLPSLLRAAPAISSWRLFIISENTPGRCFATKPFIPTHPPQEGQDEIVRASGLPRGHSFPPFPAVQVEEAPHAPRPRPQACPSGLCAAPSG